MCTGGQVRLAKYAARLLGQLKQTAACETIIEVRVFNVRRMPCVVDADVAVWIFFAKNVLEKLASDDVESYPACMATIAEMARSASLVLHEQWSTVEDAITKTLLPREDGRFSIEQDVSNRFARHRTVTDVSSITRRRRMNRGATSAICLLWVEQRSWLSK